MSQHTIKLHPAQTAELLERKRVVDEAQARFNDAVSILGLGAGLVDGECAVHIDADRNELTITLANG